MPKNITVQIGDDLAVKMEKLRDVNWSEVVRDCVDKYCNLRLGADIEALAKKMKLQKEEAYSNGYKTALEWFKQENVNYAQVNALFLEEEEFKNNFDVDVRNRYGTWEKAYGDDPSINEKYMRELRLFWISRVHAKIEELEASYEITDAFVEGFKQALRKLSDAA